MKDPHALIVKITVDYMRFTTNQLASHVDKKIAPMVKSMLHNSKLNFFNALILIIRQIEDFHPRLTNYFFYLKKIGKLVKHFILFPLLKKPDNTSLDRNEALSSSIR